MASNQSNIKDFSYDNNTDEIVCHNEMYITLKQSLPYWTIVDIFLMFIIISGNVLTILAVNLTRSLSKRNSNKCVLNLAVSDLTVGLTLPYHIAFYASESLRANKITCIMKFCLIILTCSASISSVILVAVDRYMAILYPLHYNKYMSKRVLRLLVVLGWTASVTVSVVPIFWNEWEDGIICDMHTVMPKTYSTYILTPLFSIMWFIMLVVYWKIWREVVLHTRRMRVATCLPSIKRDWKSLQVVMMVLGSFTICWMPYVVVACVQAIDAEQTPNVILYMILFSLAKVNSGINPIIYAWKNRGFRRAFIQLIRCRDPNYRDSSRKLRNVSSTSAEEKNQVKTVSKRVEEKDFTLCVV
ncbi:histamine H2 receptor-like [Arctopsyche grandis]|uniref:histamine H2 receptor-like n=1 Tax=Arctopsyche grandis TaxID=121162 RepID=UPI00406D64ED